MSAPRKIVVTGASSGIGAATAGHLLARGDTVIGISRRNPDINHNRFNHFSIDLASIDAAEKLGELAKQHGDINAVVSIAGGGHFGSLENFSCRQIERSIAQNLLSHMFVARSFIPVLKKHSHGNVIFMGSEAALTGARQGSLYCAAKFGLRGFTQSLRAEAAGSGLHIGIVNPGMVRTEFFDDLDFRPGDDDTNALNVDDVVDAITLMLDARGNAVIDEINLSPLKHVVSKRPAE